MSDDYAPKASVEFETIGSERKTFGRNNFLEVARKKAVANKKTAKTTKRKKFRMTASELILTTIKKAGAKGATGAQIGKAWKAAGRPGSVYKTLGSLVKDGKIKRVKIKGAKGSLYR